MTQLHIGVSGLMAAQRSLAVVGHNITNVNTEGYSKQRLDADAKDPIFYGTAYYGTGVDINSVTRNYDRFLQQNVRSSTASYNHMHSLHDLSGRVDNLLASHETGLTPALDDFFNSAHDVANDPSSIPARQVFLENASSLASRINDLGLRLEEYEQSFNTKLEESVIEINHLTSAISDLNRDISDASGKGLTAIPNDLLDQRDQLIDELAGKVGVQTLPQKDGSIDVMTYDGKSLVLGNQNLQLKLTNNALDPTRKELGYDIGGSTIIISDSISSGELAGILDFRSEVLDPARNKIGQLAAGLALSVNQQHAKGLDLNGDLGADVFGLASPAFVADAENAGSITLAFKEDGAADLKATEYDLKFEAGEFTLTNRQDGSTQALSGDGPFEVDGMLITIENPAGEGDSYRLQPFRHAASKLAVNISDPRQFAIASPIRTETALTNLSNATISGGEVLDPSNVDLLAPVIITFEDPPNTYQVNGEGSYEFTNGGDIDLNGWRIQISGEPLAGDSFTVEKNVGGVGDNRNGLILAELQNKPTLESGNASYQGTYSQLVGDVGAHTRRIDLSQQALSALQDQATSARDNQRGVNLDEEAADLLKYQQSYQASAQFISIADRTFQTLLSAIGA